MKSMNTVKILLVCCMCSICFADMVVLKQGQTLTGEILAEKQSQIYIDIGVTILAVPREKILKFEYDAEQTSDANNTADVNSAFLSLQSDTFYSTAARKEASIEECVKAVSEAVVKVKS